MLVFKQKSINIYKGLDSIYRYVTVSLGEIIGFGQNFQSILNIPAMKSCFCDFLYLKLKSILKLIWQSQY